MVPLCQLQANLEGRVDNVEVGRVEQIVEVGATSVDAPVAAVLQEHLGEGQDGDDQLAVSVVPVAELLQALLRVGMLIGVLDRRSGVQEDFAGEVSHLIALLQLVRGAKRLEDAVEAVQERDPVVQVPARKRPSCRELVELSGDQR